MNTKERMNELIRLMADNLSAVAKNNSKKAKLLLQIAQLDADSEVKMSENVAYGEEFAALVAAAK